MLVAHPATPLHQPDDFFSQQNLDRADQSIAKVFGCMLGLAISPCPPPTPAIGEGEERTAIVGYSGAMRGCCELQMNSASARTAATAMLGGSPVEEEESLDDAVGELCNMVAGCWRDSVPALSSGCALTPPTIVTGRDYKVHMGRPSIRLTRCYSFCDQYIFLTLRREGSAHS